MNQKDKIILAIESSCDDTAAAVFDGAVELGYAIASQTEIHDRFGGVVPEVASRNHTMAMPKVVADALRMAGKTFADVDVVAVTAKPGLAGALLVGTSYAKALAFALGKPLVLVDHIHAHIAANYISSPELAPPFVAVVASGGHTSIFLVTDSDIQAVGATVDDAMGECLDKVGRVLGLPYPAGAHIDRLAATGKNNITFIKQGKKRVISYSGLKTAVIQYVRKLQSAGQPIPLADICASLTATACDLLIDHTLAAAKAHNQKTIALAGGVASNTYLRQTLTQKASPLGITVLAPPPRLCTDNASMVAALTAKAIQA